MRHLTPRKHTGWIRWVLLLAVAVPRLAFAQWEGSDASTASRSAPEGLAADDWNGIRAAYEAGRHAAFATPDGYQVWNPGQGWHTHFDGRGSLTTPERGEWSWGLELESYGFLGAELERTRPMHVSAEGGRVVYEWDDALEEWYVNDTRGLEHGYTLHRRPARSVDCGVSPLTLTLGVVGNLRPEVMEDRRGVRFVDAAGRLILTYSGLVVLDANGEELEASFERLDRGGKGLLLVVDESSARYPLTIDPLAQQAYLKASNTDGGDQFGRSVALSGDTVVVGAPGEDSNATGVDGNQGDNSASGSGAAYVFVRSGTSWSQEAYLKASNTDADDEFGHAVSVSGDTVVVGAHYEWSNATGVNGNQGDNSLGGAGAAYVFVRNGTIWSQEAYLKASNTDGADVFGESVALSGETLVVGAKWEASSATAVNGTQSDNSAMQAGAAYVFVRNGTSWSQQAYLKASNTDAGDSFGVSVSVSGDTAVIGASEEDSTATGVNGNQSINSAFGGSGAAYVFVRSGASWSQEAYLKASNTNTNDEFGQSVAVSGDTILVGAFSEDSSATGVNGSQNNNNASCSGAAYLFARSGTSWSQEAYLKASNAESCDHFGWSVALADGTAVVGARGEDSSATGVNGNQSSNSAPASGAAYVFARSGASWNQTAYLKASNADMGDSFGWSVAVSADSIVVGATGEDSGATGVNGDHGDNSTLEAGASFVFVPVLEPTSYCPLTPNSAGAGATLMASGSVSVAANDLGFLAGSMAAGEPGIFFYGPDQIQVPFGNGNRCVGGGPGTIVRIFPFAQADASGFMSTPIDNTNPAHAQVVPGATLNFQAWFRDPAGGGAGFNLSDALSVVFNL